MDSQLMLVETDAAALREVFHEWSEKQDLWRRDPMEVWQKFYIAVRDTTAGVRFLQEREVLKSLGQRLADWLDAEAGCDDPACNIGGGPCAECLIKVADARDRAQAELAAARAAGFFPQPQE